MELDHTTMKIDFNKKLDWSDICTYPESSTTKNNYVPMFVYKYDSEEFERSYRRKRMMEMELSYTLQAWLKYDEEQFIKRMSDYLFEQINKKDHE